MRFMGISNRNQIQAQGAAVDQSCTWVDLRAALAESLALVAKRNETVLEGPPPACASVIRWRHLETDGGDAVADHADALAGRYRLPEACKARSASPVLNRGSAVFPLRSSLSAD